MFREILVYPENRAWVAIPISPFGELGKELPFHIFKP